MIARSSFMPVIRIGVCTLDTSDGTLASASGDTHLEPKIQAVLLMLVQNHGVVVSQQELLREVWRDTHVAPGALARVISLLRQALGDDVRHPRYIETVPKRGYRLIAPVEQFDDSAVRAETPQLEPPTITESSIAAARETARSSWTYVALIGATITLLLSVAPQPRDRLTRRAMATGEFKYPHETRLGNESAFEHYTRAVARNPASADAYAGLATTYVFRANYLSDRAHWASAAIETARRAAAIDPDNLGATRALGMAHAQAGRLRDAVVYYQRVIDRSPNDYVTRTNLGRILMASGRVAEALPLFAQHIASKPTSPAGYAHLAGGLVVAGYLPEAADAARAALAIEPYELNAQMVLVKVDLLTEHFDDAETRLARLLEVHTDCVQCVVQLGLVDQVRGHSAQAAARYREARAMARQFASASLRLAHLLTLEGNHADAKPLLMEIETTLRAAIEGGDEMPMVRWHLAAAAAIRGDRALAIERYQQAVTAGRRDALWDRWDPMLSAIQSAPTFIALQSSFMNEHRAAAPLAERVRPMLAEIGHRLTQ
jgi:transcriptional activator of cad operon